MSVDTRRAGRIAAVLAGVITLALALAQVLLPRIAASRISSRVGSYGNVESVKVSAWPAVKLLWGRADSVTLRASRLKLSPAQTAQLLWEARGASTMDVTAASVNEGGLQLSDASLHKRGRALSAHARITAAGVRAALPEGVDVQLLSSEHGEVEVRASGGIFGVATSLDAVAGASEGKLVAHPLGLLLSGLRLTLFDDPRVYVEGVGASAETGQPPGYLLTISASVR